MSTNAAANQAATIEGTAALALAGARVPPLVPRSRPQPLGFEGDEHMFLGDGALLRAPGLQSVVAGQAPFVLANGLSLTYGQIVALAGDFYGVPDAPISDGATEADRESRFRDCFDSLATGDAGTPAEAKSILDIMKLEIAAVDAAVFKGAQPSTGFASLGNSLNVKWAWATSSLKYPTGRYLALAVMNWDHFGAHAVSAYQAGHAVALKTAVAAFKAPAGREQDRLRSLAFAQNAFADHFLTDLFSAGHLRTPRKELHNASVIQSAGDYFSKTMHDEDCHFGLNVTNENGASWLAYGDKRLMDTVNLPSLIIAESAVQESVDEVAQALRTGYVPTAANFFALNFVPALTKLNDERNRSALWVTDDVGTCAYRTNLNDFSDYTHNPKWTGLPLLAKFKLQYGPSEVTSPPTPTSTIAIAEGPSAFPAAGPDWTGGRVRYASSLATRNFESDFGPWSEWYTIDPRPGGALNLSRIQTAADCVSAVYRQFERPNGQRTRTRLLQTTTSATAQDDRQQSNAVQPIGWGGTGFSFSFGRDGGLWSFLSNKSMVRNDGGNAWEPVPECPNGSGGSVLIPISRHTAFLANPDGSVYFLGAHQSWVPVAGPSPIQVKAVLPGLGGQGSVLVGYGIDASGHVLCGPMKQISAWTEPAPGFRAKAISVSVFDRTVAALTSDDHVALLRSGSHAFETLPAAGVDGFSRVAVVDADRLYAGGRGSRSVWLYTTAARWSLVEGSYGTADGLAVSPQGLLYGSATNADEPGLISAESLFSAP